MTPEGLRAQFEVMAEAPNGIEKLRELILQLAVCGKLVPQDPGDESAASLFRDGQRGAEDPEPPFELPLGWTCAPLRDLGSFMGGGTPSKADASLWYGDIPWVSPKDMKRLRIRDAADHISEHALSRSAVRLIPPGALLMVVRGMILARAFPVALTERSVTVNQDMKALVPDDARLAEYLLLVLRGLEPAVLAAVERSTHGTCRLESSFLSDLVIPLPPLNEQRRIAAKVDELMALCDELEARQRRRAEARVRANRSVLHHLVEASGDEALAAGWERLRENFGLLYDAPETVAVLRRAVLQLAVRGRLVLQDPRDEPATAFVRRGAACMVERTHELPLPAGWALTKLVDIAELRIGRTPPTKAPEYWSDSTHAGVPWVSIGDMPWTGLVVGTKRRVSERAAADVFKQPPAPAGTLLMSFKLSIGKLAFLSEPAYYNEAIVAILPLLDGLTPYLQLGLRAVDLTADTKGALMGDTLNSESLRAIHIPLPPLAEQHRIVARVDELMALCDRFEARLTRARGHSVDLAASVVHHLTAA